MVAGPCRCLRGRCSVAQSTNCLAEGAYIAEDVDVLHGLPEQQLVQQGIVEAACMSHRVGQGAGSPQSWRSMRRRLQSRWAVKMLVHLHRQVSPDRSADA